MNANPERDIQTFRRALGNFATGVTVVTASDHEGNWVGVTANSFNSVSLEPPLVLWSLNRSSWSLPTYELSEYFIVNVLSDNQIEVSNRFASQGLANKFEDVETCEGIGGAPVLVDCAASFQCQKKYTYEGGDHLIFVGEVMDFHTTDSAGLIYHKGQYAVPEPHPDAIGSENGEETSFVEGYLNYLLSQAANGFERQYQVILDKYKVSRFEWRLLCCISEFQGSNLKQLSKLTIIPEHTLVDVLRDTEAKGWVRNEFDKDGIDHYYIEKAGLDLLVPLLVAAKSHESDALSKFSVTEVRQFKSMLKDLKKQVNN